MLRKIGSLTGGVLCAVAFVVLLALAENFLNFDSPMLALLRYLGTALLALLGIFMIIDAFTHFKRLNDDEFSFKSEKARKITYFVFGISILLIAAGITVLGVIY